MTIVDGASPCSQLFSVTEGACPQECGRKSWLNVQEKDAGGRRSGKNTGESVSVWVCQGSNHFISFIPWYFTTNKKIIGNISPTEGGAIYLAVVY